LFTASNHSTKDNQKQDNSEIDYFNRNEIDDLPMIDLLPSIATETTQTPIPPKSFVTTNLDSPLTSQMICHVGFGTVLSDESGLGRNGKPLVKPAVPFDENVGWTNRFRNSPSNPCGLRGFGIDKNRFYS
jgi:hypothetical protein